MSDLLDGVELKLRRAEEHLKGLDQEWQAFLEAKRPYVPIRRLEHDVADHVYIMKPLAQLPKALREQFMVRIGEVLYHLRSSLDYLALGLITPSKLTAKLERRSQFVIVPSLTEWKRQQWHLDGLTTKRRAVIERLQPYNSWNDLGRLADLSNVDKHRYPIATVAAVENQRYPIYIDIDWKAIFAKDTTLVHGAETELLRFRLDPPNPRVNMNAQFSFCMAFRDPTPMLSTRSAVDELRGMKLCIEHEVIPALLPHLP